MDRPAQGSAAESRPESFAELSGPSQSQSGAAAPAQQAGAQSALALPAALQSQPLEALQYILSGILGR